MLFLFMVNSCVILPKRNILFMFVMCARVSPFRMIALWHGINGYPFILFKDFVNYDLCLGMGDVLVYVCMNTWKF